LVLNAFRNLILIILLFAIIPTMYGITQHIQVQSDAENSSTTSYTGNNTPKTNNTNIYCIDKDKVIEAILNNPTVRDVINRLKIKIDKESIRIEKINKTNNGIEISILLNSTSDSQFALKVKCLVNQNSNLIKILQVSPIVKPLTYNSDRLSTSKAKKLLKRIDVLKKIYYDPRVYKIMKKYNISFKDFVEATKSVGLEGNKTYDTLSIQMFIYVIHKGNTTIYIVDKPSTYEKFHNMSFCPPVIWIDIQFYNEQNTVEVTGVLEDSFYMDPRCFLGPMMPKK